MIQAEDFAGAAGRPDRTHDAVAVPSSAARADTRFAPTNGGLEAAPNLAGDDEALKQLRTREIELFDRRHRCG